MFKETPHWKESTTGCLLRLEVHWLWRNDYRMWLSVWVHYWYISFSWPCLDIKDLVPISDKAKRKKGKTTPLWYALPAVAWIHATNMILRRAVILCFVRYKQNCPPTLWLDGLNLSPLSFETPCQRLDVYWWGGILNYTRWCYFISSRFWKPFDSSIRVTVSYGTGEYSTGIPNNEEVHAPHSCLQIHPHMSYISVYTYSNICIDRYRVIQVSYVCAYRWCTLTHLYVHTVVPGTCRTQRSPVNILRTQHSLWSLSRISVCHTTW